MCVRRERGWRCGSGAEYLLSMCEALLQSPQERNEKRKGGERKEEKRERIFMILRFSVPQLKEQGTIDRPPKSLLIPQIYLYNMHTISTGKCG